MNSHTTIEIFLCLSIALNCLSSTLDESKLCNELKANNFLFDFGLQTPNQSHNSFLFIGQNGWGIEYTINGIALYDVPPVPFVTNFEMTFMFTDQNNNDIWVAYYKGGLDTIHVYNPRLDQTKQIPNLWQNSTDFYPTFAFNSLDMSTEIQIYVVQQNTTVQGLFERDIRVYEISTKYELAELSPTNYPIPKFFDKLSNASLVNAIFEFTSQYQYVVLFSEGTTLTTCMTDADMTRNQCDGVLPVLLDCTVTTPTTPSTTTPTITSTTTTTTTRETTTVQKTTTTQAFKTTETTIPANESTIDTTLGKTNGNGEDEEETPVPNTGDYQTIIVIVCLTVIFVSIAIIGIIFITKYFISKQEKKERMETLKKNIEMKRIRDINVGEKYERESGIMRSD